MKNRNARKYMRDVYKGNNQEGPHCTRKIIDNCLYFLFLFPPFFLLVFSFLSNLHSLFQTELQMFPFYISLVSSSFQLHLNEQRFLDLIKYTTWFGGGKGYVLWKITFLACFLFGVFGGDSGDTSVTYVSGSSVSFREIGVHGERESEQESIHYNRIKRSIFKTIK